MFLLIPCPPTSGPRQQRRSAVCERSASLRLCGRMELLGLAQYSRHLPGWLPAAFTPRCSLLALARAVPKSPAGSAKPGCLHPLHRSRVFIVAHIVSRCACKIAMQGCSGQWPCPQALNRPSKGWFCLEMVICKCAHMWISSGVFLLAHQCSRFLSGEGAERFPLQAQEAREGMLRDKGFGISLIVRGSRL